MITEKQRNEYIEAIKKEIEDAQIEYEQIMAEDKGKDFMDILPADFKKVKRSILKRSILSYIDKVTDFLNTCGLYEDRKFTKNEVVRYMMRGTYYSNFHVAYLLIPRKDTTFEKENEKEIQKYRDLEHLMACMRQIWEQYEDRCKIKKGELVDDWDMEKDGYPRTGRGSLCYLFTPVKGEWKANQTGKFKLLNPRNNKVVEYEILGYKAKDDIYACLNEKGKKVFLTEYSEVEEAYSCLFSSNKEIYSGWWNKTMILK